MGKNQNKPAVTQPDAAKEKALAKENAQLKKDLAEALKTNNELQKKTETVRKEKSTGRLSVTRDKVTYDIMFPKMRHQGEIITAQEVKENGALADELIKMRSGMLKKRISKS